MKNTEFNNKVSKGFTKKFTITVQTSIIKDDFITVFDIDLIPAINIHSSNYRSGEYSKFLSVRWLIFILEFNWSKN